MREEVHLREHKGAEGRWQVEEPQKLIWGGEDPDPATHSSAAREQWAPLSGCETHQDEAWERLLGPPLERRRILPTGCGHRYGIQGKSVLGLCETYYEMFGGGATSRGKERGIKENWGGTSMGNSEEKGSKRLVVHKQVAGQHMPCA